MKRPNTIERLLAALLGVLCLGACSKGLQTYNGDAGIYFAMKMDGNYANADTMYTAVTTLPFVTTDSQDSVLHIKVKILGNVSSSDRTFRIETVQDSTDVLPEECDFPDGEHVLKAGEVFGSIPVHFTRAASLKGKEKTLKIRLVETRDFSLPIAVWKNSSTEYVDVLTHTIIVSDKYVQLPGFEEYAFGPFSEKKMKLILEISGLELQDFNQKMSHVYLKALGQKLDRYLKEQAAKGTPVLEEDGTPMVSGEYIYI